MTIGEAGKATGLTKKAIEYYVERGLVTPDVLENGYRAFSRRDIDRLNKVAILRRLGIGTADIKKALADPSAAFLKALSVQKELKLQRERIKKTILDKLSSGKAYFEVKDELQAIDDGKTITEKLLEAFPGYYGHFICLHFSRFLNEPIKTEAQRAAFKKILAFLDDMPAFDIPDDLREYLVENTEGIGAEQIAQMLENVKRSIENPDGFLADNKEALEWYLAYKQSREYKDSPACKIMALMKEFNSASGYNDLFIPAMKELSASYAAYYAQLEIANKELLARYPGIGETN